MTKLFVFGVNGKMGRFIVDLASSHDCEVVGGFDIVAHPTVPTYNDINAVPLNFDIIIDFSRAELLDSVCALALKSNKGAVICSTGYSSEQVKQIEQLSTSVPVLRSGNMSVGINLLLSLVEQATKVLGESFDIEIVEKHHNQKADAPSGTALMLADTVKSVKTDARYLYGRVGASKREKQDVTIHAIRGGTIIGEHDVIFAGNDEIITLSHVALSRKVFAEGALTASKFLLDKKNGLFNMKNALN
ncbi:MAG: 4-hydroxy-tetrahydrodipicolinate reductase [Clostridia bacterium]|nr:4-hydroxy-tetrahydrodipicolinate reductase [Clostridia bacterium]